MGDRRARPARADQHHPVERAPGSPRANASGSRCASVLWPTVRPSVEDDGVDRAERRRLGGELVEVLDDELLARVGDVDAAKPSVARLAHERADRLGARAELVEVEQPVVALEPEPRAPPARAARG